MPHTSHRRAMSRALSLALLLLAAAAARAEVRLPAVVGGNMVLQRESQVPLWGWADPGEPILITLDWRGEPYQVIAGADGRWEVHVETPGAGGPHEIEIRGENVLTLTNVLIGEVWVCSGQSNMEWPVAAADHAAREIAAAGYPQIRLFQVERAVAATPARDCRGAWVECSPETISGFSAVGYFFGRELQQNLDVPIGLIHSSWGGTICEAWTSWETLAAQPQLADALAHIRRVREDPEGAERELAAQRAAWWEALAAADPGSRDGEQGAHWRAELDDADWGVMPQPTNWQETDLQSFDGVVWLRRYVAIPAAWAGRELTLNLGPIDDMDTVYFNGERIGGLEELGRWTEPRSYTVPAELVHAGRNVLAVRVVDTGGYGGLAGPAELMHVRLRTDEQRRLPLDGDWRIKSGAPLQELASFPAGHALHANSPTALYNGMIAPIIPFGIRGAIWYQGESNRTRARQYGELFPAMIRDWRDKWGRGEFPFYFVQIAPFAYGGDSGQAAELREAQRHALRVPNTGMAVAMDIGNPRDIHPTNKQAVGRRLALWALANTYGEAGLVCSGPLYRNMRREPGGLRLYFEYVGSGLSSRGQPLAHFEIAGADGKFVPAEAEIQGDTVFVWSDEVREPHAARYAWGAADEASLFNNEGLPASSFHTGMD